MITVISGTNRDRALTLEVAQYIKNYIHAKWPLESCELLDLGELEFTLNKDQYAPDQQSEDIRRVQDEVLNPSRALIFVVPEYNGGFPGILKLFIDAISVRNYKEAFAQKTALLVGVATGRAGNLRGLDQLDQILQYLGVFTYPKKFPISQAHFMMEDGKMIDPNLQKDLLQTVTSYLEFSKYDIPG